MDIKSRKISRWSLQRQELYYTAKQWGVAESAAFSLAEQDLEHWSGEQLTAILGKVRDMRPGVEKRTISPPKTQAAQIAEILTHLNLASASPQNYRIKPSSELVARSAIEGTALCVNAHGQFALRHPGEAYIAISHVWAEGLQADAQNQGFAQHQLDRVFQLVAGIDVEWIWLDVLAVPSGDRALSAYEETQKIDIINHMASIYRNATAVVIFDALVMDLMSVDPVDVAVVLLCGKWMTRVWTYQEIKLAKKAIVLTGAGKVEFQDILDALRTSIGGIDYYGPTPAAGSILRVKWDQFRLLCIVFDVLTQCRPDTIVSLPDIALACRNRVAGNDLDYSRAFFPVLGLKWRVGMTREEGMRTIYEQQPFGYLNATRIMLMYGRPRTYYWPGWAPDSLCGLRGEILDHSQHFDLQRRGIEGNWDTFKITKYLHLDPERIKNGLAFDLLEEDTSHGSRCFAFHAESEQPATLIAIEKLILEGKGYLLTFRPLKWGGTTALVIERLGNSNEAYVYLVISLTAVSLIKDMQPRKWLLRSENPMSTGFEAGKTRAKSIALFDNHPTMENGGNPGQTLLHQAAIAGDLEQVRFLLQQGAVVDAEDRDSRTPLVVAADRHPQVVEALLKAGANPSHQKFIFSPLILAVRGRSLLSARLLLDYGADVDDRSSNLSWPLREACDRPELTELLLSYGADPNRSGVYGVTALMFAARAGDTKVAGMLISKGAHLNAQMSDDDRKTALSWAINRHRDEFVELLLAKGADPDTRHDADQTPLMLAAKNGNYRIVRLLLDAGAQVNALDRDARTALELAEENGHHIAAKMIQERIGILAEG